MPHFSFLWVKFFSDATTNQPGFVANLQNVDPICGSHISLNVTETVQVTNSSVEIQKYFVNGTIFTLRKNIGMGGGSEKGIFFLTLCHEVCQLGPRLKTDK